MQSRDAYKNTSLNEYLSGCLTYLKIYKDIPWVKYEEVVENPNEMLEKFVSISVSNMSLLGKISGLHTQP